MKPTIKDVAKLADVSIGTVSNVINNTGNVKPLLKKRVVKAINDLDYFPNAIARSLQSSNSKTIGVLLADLTNPFQMTLAKGIEEITYSHGYQILISSTRDKPEMEKRNLEMFYQKRVGGIIVCPTGMASEELQWLINNNIPVGLVDRPMFSLKSDIVADNNLLGMELLVEHLYQLGHREIGVVYGDMSSIHGRLRYEGFNKAATKYGLNISPNHQFNGNFTFGGGKEAVHYFNENAKEVTAIVSVNNNMTAGILSACRELRLDIPNDLSVASFGELEYKWNLIKPSITFIRQSPLEIGKKATKLMLTRLNNKSVHKVVHHLLEPELIIGESTKEI